MSTRLRTLTLAVTSLCLLFAANASLAHTALASSSPKANATLEQSPAAIEIQFRDPAKLTAVVVTGADTQSRKLEFAAGEKANIYVLPKPNLSAGRNEIKWTALSHDGHVIRGTLVFTIKPGARQN